MRCLWTIVGGRLATECGSNRHLEITGLLLYCLDKVASGVEAVEIVFGPLKINLINIEWSSCVILSKATAEMVPDKTCNRH